MEQVEVRYGNRSLSVNIHLSNDVRLLKVYLHVIHGVPYQNLKLMHQGILLADRLILQRLKDVYFNDFTMTLTMTTNSDPFVFLEVVKVIFTNWNHEGRSIQGLLFSSLETIGEVKGAVVGRLGYPASYVDRTTLMLNGRKLANFRTLLSCNVKKMAVIYCHLNMQ